MFKKYLLLLLITSILISLTGCDVSENEDKHSDEVVVIDAINRHNFPRIDGSTSTYPLTTVIACEILHTPFNWVDAMDGTRVIYPTDTTADARFIREIRFSGTHNSYVKLIKDSTDIILVAREPSEDEVSLANSLNVNIETAPIALDGLIFILNSANSINNLSSEQIIGIYTGVIKNWNEAGGADRKINPYTRNRNSGSQELMEKVVMQGRQMINAPAFEINSMMPMIYSIGNDPDAVGYTVYYYNTTMVPRTDVKTISINNVYPDPQSISNRTYPYTSPVFAVIRSDTDESSTAYLLWKWLQTNTGQLTVAKSGYVPYSK